MHDMATLTGQQLQPYELDIPVTWMNRPSREDYLAAKMRAWCRDFEKQNCTTVAVTQRPSTARHSNSTPTAAVELEDCTERPFVSPTPEAVRTITRRWSYFQDLIARELEWHGLTRKGWTVKYDNCRARAGQCDQRTKTLSFSRHLIVRGPIKELRNTLLHEIAHALAGSKHGHDRTWRNIAVKIGCDGERCHTMELTRPKWRFLCSAGCWEITCHRRCKGHKQTCKQCNAACIYVRF
jgi:predicted SprT family Zn-dependent metalloprotease